MYQMPVSLKTGKSVYLFRIWSDRGGPENNYKVILTPDPNGFVWYYISLWNVDAWFLCVLCQTSNIWHY